MWARAHGGRPPCRGTVNQPAAGAFRPVPRQAGEPDHERQDTQHHGPGPPDVVFRWNGTFSRAAPARRAHRQRFPCPSPNQRRSGSHPPGDPRQDRRPAGAGLPARAATADQWDQHRGPLPLGDTRSRAGGDLYEIIPTAHGIRVIIGDVRGQGLERGLAGPAGPQRVPAQRGRGARAGPARGRNQPGHPPAPGRRGLRHRSAGPDQPRRRAHRRQLRPSPAAAAPRR